jgi:hypothetical protein
MSMYLMSVMAGNAAGAAIWGTVASRFGVSASLAASSLVGVALLLAMRWLRLSDRPSDDHRPRQSDVTAGVLPTVDASDRRPVTVMIEYLVDPGDEAEFAEVMRYSRRARLRGGALSWGLLRDAADSRRRIEFFVDENWVEHARRLERLTAADERLRERRMALHKGPLAPAVMRYFEEEVSR